MVFPESVVGILKDVESIKIYPTLCFIVIFFGYIAHSSALQFFYYYKTIRNKNDKKGIEWKIQEKNDQSVNRFWFLPLLSRKPNRGPYHRLLTTFNLVQASLFAYVASYMCCIGKSYISFAPMSEYGMAKLLLDLLRAVVYENIVEYYWHRLMHTNAFYATFHKIHHHYKSPEPWDDMYIHPLEAFGYYCILYGPPFLFNMHIGAFYGYMVIMGLCGVYDHSGIRVSVPGIYNTVDHDNHHKKFEVNYAFPFPFMDILHGTFEGEFWGKQYKRKGGNNHLNQHR